MATNRNILLCDVCKTVTTVRTLIGFFDEHPLRLVCGGCNIRIDGTAFIDQENATYHFEFQNVTEPSDPEHDAAAFYAEASAELLTEKIIPTKDGKIPSFPEGSPFFRAMREMGRDKVLEYNRHISGFIGMRRKEWPQFRRILELWRDQTAKWLEAELRKLLPDKQLYPLNNGLELLKGLRHLMMVFLSPIISRDTMGKVVAARDQLTALANGNPPEAVKLVTLFDQQLLSSYRTMIVSRLILFVEKFPYLAPVFSLDYYPAGVADEKYISRKWISTAAFEDIKDFYVEQYEDAGNALRLVLALNNWAVRGSLEAMPPRENNRPEVATFNDFDRLSKGNRIRLINPAEPFSFILLPALDREIRNAIGHNSFEFNRIQQTITYWGDANRRDAPKTITLIAFARKCWDASLGVIMFSELVLWLERFHRFAAGEAPAPIKAWKRRFGGRKSKKKKLTGASAALTADNLWLQSKIQLNRYPNTSKFLGHNMMPVSM